MNFRGLFRLPAKVFTLPLDVVEWWVRILTRRFGLSLSAFVVINALRNKRRAILSIMSVAVSLFLFVTLLVTMREFTIPPEDVGASLRIAVRNKVSLAAPLPQKLLPILEKIPGVAAVTPFSFFGGKFRDDDFTTFAQFATDPVRFTNVFVEAKTTLPDLRRGFATGTPAWWARTR